MLATALAAGLAFAATASASSTPKPACLKTATSQADLNDCTGVWLRHAEARLAKALALASKKYEPGLVARSQKAWLAYRRQECLLEASVYAGGTIYPQIYGTCEVGMDDARTAELARDVANLPH